MWTSAPLPSPDIDIYIQTHQICLRFRCVYVWVFIKCDVYFRYTADKYDIYGFFHVITCLRFFVNLSTYTVVSATCPVLDWSKSKTPVEVRTLESPRNPVDSHGAGYSRGSQETNFYSRGRPCILVVDSWLSWCDEVALSYRSSSQRVAGRNNSRFGGPLKRRNWGWFSTRVNKHFMFETTSEARHLHSCSALEAAFFLPIFFSSLSCECNWKHAAARVMSSELYQNRTFGFCHWIQEVEGELKDS